MTTTKHTPGPWRAIGRDVLSMHIYPRASGPLICIVDDNDTARWVADAALIAAAPELLAACERVVERWETHDGQMNRIDDVLAVIAKAKGETK